MNLNFVKSLGNFVEAVLNNKHYIFILIWTILIFIIIDYDKNIPPQY